MAVLALVVLVCGVLSDLLIGGFWVRRALLASIVGSVIVVMLSVAVVNEVVERRRRRRWTVLAQYVMFELVRNARMIWSAVLGHRRLADQRPKSARLCRRRPPSCPGLVTTNEEDEIRKLPHHFSGRIRVLRVLVAAEA
jgi:hypothetical protein